MLHWRRLITTDLQPEKLPVKVIQKNAHWKYFSNGFTFQTQINLQCTKQTNIKWTHHSVLCLLHFTCYMFCSMLAKAWAPFPSIAHFLCQRLSCCVLHYSSSTFLHASLELGTSNHCISPNFSCKNTHTYVHMPIQRWVLCSFLRSLHTLDQL